MSTKNSSDTIGDQTRDLRACSAVPCNVIYLFSKTNDMYQFIKFILFCRTQYRIKSNKNEKLNKFEELVHLGGFTKEKYLCTVTCHTNVPLYQLPTSNKHKPRTKERLASVPGLRIVTFHFDLPFLQPATPIRMPRAVPYRFGPVGG
jgi:hypothetical protein